MWLSASNKTYCFSFIVVGVLLVISGFIFSSTIVSAGFSHNVLGWAWGGTQNTFNADTTGLGWVSTNSMNCDFDGNGQVEAGEVLDAPGCTEGLITDYGVNVSSNGKLSGYAWSENYGWISFQESDWDNCPDDSCPPLLSPPNRVYGWARILSLRDPFNSDLGGWIKLSAGSDDVVNWMVTYNSVEQTFGGYAYSDEVGWIDFGPIPDSEVGSISAVPCKIAVEESACDTATISWDLTEGSPAYEVESLTTDLIIGTTQVTPNPVHQFLMVYGENQVRASAAGLYDAIWTGNATCEDGLFFHSGLMTPVCKRPPILSITPIAPGRISRQEAVSNIEFGILANYDAVCQVYGSVPVGTYIVHTGAPDLVMHSFMTDPLRSAQTIKVECGVIGIPESMTASFIRIAVVPSYQER